MFLTQIKTKTRKNAMTRNEAKINWFDFPKTFKFDPFIIWISSLRLLFYSVHCEVSRKSNNQKFSARDKNVMPRKTS